MKGKFSRHTTPLTSARIIILWHQAGSDWFSIDAITEANPPPDFISSSILIQIKWEQDFKASRYEEKRQEEAQTRRNRFGK